MTTSTISVSKSLLWPNTILWLSKGEKSHGGIVVSHYLLASKFNMHPLSIELVKRGFTVINLEFRGHGASSDYFSGGELKNDMKNIMVSKDSNITKISVIGIGMMNQSGVAAKVFKIFADNDIEFQQVTTSEISISYTKNGK